MKPSTSLLKPPEVPAGEDDISFQRHINQIKAELSKKRKKKSKYYQQPSKANLFDVSKRYHRNPCHSSEVLKKYPFLKDVDQIYHLNGYKYNTFFLQLLLEMEMICGSEKIVQLETLGVDYGH